MRFVFLVAAIGFATALTSTAALTSSAVLADDIYVNNVRGDDKFNGRPTTDSTANSGPLRSIERALQIAKRGDRIIIERTDVAYYESLSLQGTRHSGTEHLPFTILSNGATVDGTSAIDPRSWEHHEGNVFRFEPELKSFQQIYLDGKPAERVPTASSSSVPNLEARQWALVDGSIYFCTDAGRIPGQYDIRYCKRQTGFTLYEVENVIIDGLIVQGFQLDGINAHDAVNRTVVRNCKLRGNGRSGISVGGASRLQLNSSVVGANGAAQTRSEGYCWLHIRDCRLLESATTGPAMDQDGGRISVDGRDYLDALSTIRRKP